MESVLTLDGVSLRRGDTQILENINWQAKEGEHWVILGPNGAGKTSLVQLISGRMFPSSGQVLLLGEEMGKVEVSELHRQIGVCSSSLRERIHSDETVEDVILSAIYGVLGTWRQVYEETDRQRAGNLQQAFGVEKLSQRSFGTLSDGEKQRVLIARALMADPEILILDEPAAGLDMGAREELLGALAELATDKKSPMMIMVTQHMEEIPQGFTHGLLLKEGKMTASGMISSTLTDDNLSNNFSLPLQVTRDNGRYWVRARA